MNSKHDKVKAKLQADINAWLANGNSITIVQTGVTGEKLHLKLVDEERKRQRREAKRKALDPFTPPVGPYCGDDILHCDFAVRDTHFKAWWCKKYLRTIYPHYEIETNVVKILKDNDCIKENL